MAAVKQLTLELLEELIAQSLHAPDSVGASGQAIAATRSALPLDPNQPIKLATGHVLPFSRIGPKTPVHCPHHADEHASGFVVVNQHGVHGLGCSACACSYWPAGSDGDVDFYSFDRAVKRAHEHFVEHRDYGPFGDFFNGPAAIRGLLGSNIKIVDTPGPTELLPGLTFVKAPKGAGKTATVSRLVADAPSVLLIGHRRSLIHQSSARLGLACYLDARDWYLRERRLGVCFDSLGRVRWGRRFDVVVIDEVEQVLAHVLADTVEQRKGGGRERLFKQLCALVAQAERVIALDADFDWTSFNALVRMKAGSLPDAAQGDLFEPKRPAVRLVVNEARPGIGRTIEVYRSKGHLVAEAMRMAASGARIMITANSRALVEKLAGAMETKLPGLRKIVITSETVSGEAQRALLQSPATEALNYDIIFTSPAVGTGVDITFRDRASLIDAVFGFCEADITTHWDFDQQIARVRHPGAVKVWLTPRRLHYETHPDIVRRELWEGSIFKHLLIDTNGPGGTARYVEDDPLIDLASQVIARQRASKNALRAHFVAYKESQGFAVNFVGPDPDSRAEGGDLLREGEEASLAAHTNRVIAAAPLGCDDYSRVKWIIEAGVQLPEDDWLSFVRTRLELFYRQPVSPELIALDDRGRYRPRIAMFESLDRLAPQDDPEQPLPRETNFLRGRQHGFSAISRLLRLSGLLTEDGFDGNIIVDGTMLSAFVRFAADNKGAIENQLNIEVRRDLEKKPISQLKAVLRLVGLDLIKAEAVKRAGEKIYRYRLDPDKLKRARTVAEDRRRLRAWRFMAELHRWPDDAHDEDMDDAA